jgi:ABC-2 type transport system ATP-binding protein
VAGFDVMNDSEKVRRSLGYLPQAVPIYPEMRVDEYLTYRAKLKGVERNGRQNRIDYCLERCRCKEVRRRLVGTLSNGYRQRVGLADALLADPPILILDEPTAGLDPLQIRETLSTIKGLRGQHTVLLSTHILSEVESVCERVIIINQGRIGLDEKLERLGSDYSVVQLEVRGPADAVGAALKKVPGVVSVSQHALGNGVAAFELQVAADHDVREAVYQIIAKNSEWTMRRLDQRRRKLEDHFVDVVLRGASTNGAINV